MAYTTINKHTDYFNTKLYTGNGTAIASGGQAITGVGFQPDWVWIKERSSTSPHKLLDSIRGVTKELETNANNAESTEAESLTAFGTDGFTVGSNGAVNQNSQTYVAWNWKAGTTGSGTTSGSGYGKAYSYSVNTAAGFSIITYKGNGSAGHTIPHHLGTTPSFIIVKNMDSTQSWLVGLTTLGWTKNLHLNEDGAVETSSAIWNDTAPTSSVFTVGTNTKCNTDDTDYIAYAFAEKVGYSKFGQYSGNGNSDGTYVYTGFRPSFVIVKNSSTGNNEWVMHDNKRNTFNPTNKELVADNNYAEYDDVRFDFLSNGFKVRDNVGYVNSGGDAYVYMAFGQSIVSSTNVVANAR
tara:strand:- start:46 stop:1101 length:1056 start_codon:yes stop_codon:yes gene_type:complete